MKFSIVVPVYNVANFLPAALNSVLGQTINDVASPYHDMVSWEVVCVDDGSTDDSGKILDEYAAHDDRFHVVHQKNAGVSAARNVALDIATGDWILWLDGDDLLNRMAIEKIYEGLLHREDVLVDIVRFGFVCFQADGTPDWTANCDGFSATRENHSIIDSSSVIDTRCLNSLNWLHAYRHEHIRDIRFRKYGYAEDSVYQTEAVVRAKIMMTLNVPLYGYRQDRPGSAMTDAKQRRPNFKRIMEGLDSSFDAIDLIANCEKKHDSIRIHYLIVKLMEESMYYALKTTKEEQKIIFSSWYDKLQICSGFSNEFSLWARFAIFLNVHVRLRIVAVVTCAIPYWLKQHGVHRA